MCFSAAASFVTAVITGIVGVTALTRVREPRELPLAVTPLLFGLQQGIEGLLWINLQHASDGSLSETLTLLFLFFAEPFWPFYAPLTVWLIEPDERRRHFVAVCLAIGTAVSAYLLWWILGHPQPAAILDGHIVYGTGFRQPAIVGGAYLIAVGLPLLLASQRAVVMLGGIVVFGLLVTYAFYWDAFISVWCFFAAAASVTILCHFEWSRPRRAADLLTLSALAISDHWCRWAPDKPHSRRPTILSSRIDNCGAKPGSAGHRPRAST